MTCPERDSVERSPGERWTRLAGFMGEWWRVAAYRAWIGTLSLVALTALLILPSQSRDILSGIGDILTLGGQGGMSPGFRWDGVIAYTALWLAGLFLALALALVVRVTGLLEFGNAYHDMPEHDQSRRRVVINYSALIFIGTLSVIHLEHLSAGANVYEAGAVMAIVSAVALTPWFLLNRWNVSRAWRIGVYLVIAVLIAGFAFYGTYKHSDERFAADVVSCATPALALIAVLSRDLPFPVRDKGSTALLIVLALLLSLLVLTLVVENSSAARNIIRIVQDWNYPGCLCVAGLARLGIGLLFTCCASPKSAVGPPRFCPDDRSDHLGILVASGETRAGMAWSETSRCGNRGYSGHAAERDPRDREIWRCRGSESGTTRNRCRCPPSRNHKIIPYSAESDTTRNPCRWRRSARRALYRRSPRHSG